MIWAIDFHDKNGVAMRHRFTGHHTWMTIGRLADQYNKEGCKVTRIELIRK